MWGYRLVKNTIKYLAGCASVAAASLDGETKPGRACILEYHRVAQTRALYGCVDNWNVTPSNFERQARWLAEETECVPLEQLFAKIRSGQPGKPLVALSFDDGFANFHQNVLPVLRRYRLPATLTVVTRFVGSSTPFPFDLWGEHVLSKIPDIAWRPITWPELEECVASGCVSVGSHSHNHLMASHCSPAELVEEVETSREIIKRRLGRAQAGSYCYPYGCSILNEVNTDYVAAVQNAGYQLAITTDLGLVCPDSSPFRLPRVEVHAWDSPAMVRAKVLGHLAPFRLLQHLRSERGREARRSGGSFASRSYEAEMRIPRNQDFAH
jgi:peptidoglycan/xylan/chitin deacetylase (PgdA/CDA1 family)